MACEALLEALEVGTTSEKIRAAAEILDRGGLPKSSQVETTLRADLALSGKALLEMAAKLRSPEPAERRRPLRLAEAPPPVPKPAALMSRRPGPDDGEEMRDSKRPWHEARRNRLETTVSLDRASNGTFAETSGCVPTYQKGEGGLMRSTRLHWRHLPLSVSLFDGCTLEPTWETGLHGSFLTGRDACADGAHRFRYAGRGARACRVARRGPSSLASDLVAS